MAVPIILSITLAAVLLAHPASAAEGATCGFSSTPFFSDEFGDPTLSRVPKDYKLWIEYRAYADEKERKAELAIATREMGKYWSEKNLKNDLTTQQQDQVLAEWLLRKKSSELAEKIYEGETLLKELRSKGKVRQEDYSPVEMSLNFTKIVFAMSEINTLAEFRKREEMVANEMKKVTDLKETSEMRKR